MSSPHKQPITIVWFRQDLRLFDNPALYAAAKQSPVLPIYILDDESAGEHPMGAASRVWLHHSLQSLNHSLNHSLCFYRGNALLVFQELMTRYTLQSVYWNRCYEPWRIQRDKQLKTLLESHGITVHSSNGSLLWEPWTIRKKDDTPYRVFTPFYRKGCLTASAPREPLPKPKNLRLYADQEQALHLEQLALLPHIHWQQGIESTWSMGEKAAHRCLTRFLKVGIKHYKGGRDFPAKPNVSRLSPYLHFGELSPNQVWYAARACGDNEHIDHFCSELGWREFSYSQLYFKPDLPKQNLQTKFNAFPWRRNKKHLKAWQQGQTGIPIVDAGMRELWQTGYMHNRVRMIVASLLVKNLLIHWRQGERWFWDCLLDADLANNSASWQWVAGCGADAAPYFRIFNPVTQAYKFDPEGVYIRQFVPELAALPDKYLFAPWEAPLPVLHVAGVVLGKTYPKPIVDLKESRQAALSAFQSLGSTRQ